MTRDERIDVISRAIEAGAYQVPVDEVARAVLRSWTMDDIIEAFDDRQATGSEDPATSDSASR